MPIDNRTGKFLEEQEGSSPEVYTDTQGNPTVGIGSNLNSPEVPQILGDMGIPREDVKSGDRVLTSDEQQELLKRQLEDKATYWENIKKRDMPNAHFQPNEETALKSMMYNSPQLIGPNMRDLLDQNKKDDVVKEILLKSNKYKEPGIEKRRLEEAQTYAGPNFENVVSTLSNDEKEQVRNIIKGIKNINERKRVLEEYPFLKDLVPTRSYGKLLKD